MAWNVAVAESASAILGDAALTIVIGLVVVFSVLLLLTGIFKAFGIVMEKLQSKEQSGSVSEVEVKAPVATPVDLGPMVSTAQIRNGITDEQVAVIACAVATSLPAGEKYAITKIDLAD